MITNRLVSESDCRSNIDRSDNQLVGRAALTIAIPSYNRVNSVHALLKSILEQVQIGDEVIVSDDGSTDGTPEVAEKAGAKVIRHEKNMGMVSNWNSCLQKATREWVCIIHDDDSLLPGALDALRSACTLANGPALITHRFASERPGDAFRCIVCNPSSSSVLDCPTIPSGAVVHKTILEKVGFFDPKFEYSADLEYFPRIAAHFPLIVIESPNIINYRLHGANYQLKTWSYPDFYRQLEDLQKTIIQHAGVEEENVGRHLLEQRQVSNLLYMLKTAQLHGSRELVRSVAERCRKFSDRLSIRQKVTIYIAARTGRYLCLGSLRLALRSINAKTFNYHSKP